MARITRRLSLAAALVVAAGTLLAQDYSPPPANVPDDAAVKTIQGKMAKLEQNLMVLRRQGVRDHYLVDIEVYLRAAEKILKHNEFFHKDSVKWTNAALDRGLLRASLLGMGSAPWIEAPPQTVARGFRSRIDGTVQPYAVTYPVNFNKVPGKKWRVDVVLHGRDNSLTEVKFLNAHSGNTPTPPEQDFVKVEVYGRGNNAYRWAGETDVFEVIDQFIYTERFFSRDRVADPNRVVLRGFSMGGAGTWHLGLHWPDRWVCIGPGAGFTTTHGYARLPAKLPPYQEACLTIYDAVDYALNAFDVPVVAYSGSKDPQKAAADNIERELKKLGIPMTHLIAPGLEHRFPPEWFKKANEYYSKYADQGRAEYPDTVNFVTYTLKYPTCDWVAILGLDRHYEKAHVLATRHDTGFLVKTQNIRALHLTMPLGVNTPQHIDIDGQKVVARPFANSAGTYHVYLQKKGGAWRTTLAQRLIAERQQRPQKALGTTGPIDDAFADSFLCVRGTGKPWHEATQKAADDRLERFAHDWSKYWRGTLPVKDDTEVSADDLATKNLVLFGDPASNSLLATALDGLPLTWTKDEIRMNGKAYPAAGHLPVLIYPSPLNPLKYVVLNTGTTIPTADYTKTNALFFPRLGDYAMLRVDPALRDPHGAEVLDAGLFNEYWQFERKQEAP
jgi:dienelactone hydrolase